MQFSIRFVPAFILLLTAAGCNCCYQPGYYAPNGLAYAPTLRPPAFQPLPKPTWLGSRSKKHDPATCPLCNSHASSSPGPAPYQQPLAVPHNGEFIHDDGAIGHSHGAEGFHQHYPDQPVQLNGIVPTSYTDGSHSESGVRHASHESHDHGAQGGCGCGSPGCRSGCNGNCGHSKGQCGADRNRKGGCGPQHTHKPTCSGAKNCGCGAPSNCGCSGVVSNYGPCMTCDSFEGFSMGGEGFPMSGTVIDSGCSTCGTSFGGNGISMGSVIPGTMMNGEIISGGMIPGEVIGDGVIFDGSIVNGGSYPGTTYATDKPCPNCGKNHSTKMTPMPEGRLHEEATPGEVTPGTLRPHTTPAQPYDEKATSGGAAGPATEKQTVPATNDPSATSIPEAFPSSFGSPRTTEESLPTIHPPAGEARAKTTPTSWRTSGSRPAQIQNSAGEFHEPVPASSGSIQPTTLMIPTIPDRDDTRHVHWIPGNAK